MRDIKPNKNSANKFNLPPLNGGEYEDLELYEASMSEKSKRKSTVPDRPARSAIRKPLPATNKNLGGSKVPIAPVKISDPTTKRRPMFVQAPLKDPGKIQVGKNEYKVMLVLVGLVLIAAAIASIIFLPTAAIELRLITAPLLVDDKLSVGATTASEGTVPGTSFFREIAVEGSWKVENTEVVGSKSRGEVDIVNLTTSEQKIKEKSRLVTKDGILFYMDKHAIVPPNSRIRVGVEAAEEGSEGNIEPQKLTFAALDDASKSIVFAESVSKFTEGSGETVAVVSEQDINKAKEEAVTSARQQAQGQIQNELPKGWTLLDESWDMVIDDITFGQNVGDKMPVLDYKGSITAKVMAYERTVFEEKMREKLEETINEDYMLFPGPISYSQSVDSVDWENANSTVAIRVTHSTIPKISLDTLREKLAGRTADEAKEYLEGMPGVRSASMKLWPFWVQSIPRIEKRIEINLEPEKSV